MHGDAILRTAGTGTRRSRSGTEGTKSRRRSRTSRGRPDRGVAPCRGRREAPRSGPGGVGAGTVGGRGRDRPRGRHGTDSGPRPREPGQCGHGGVDPPGVAGLEHPAHPEGNAGGRAPLHDLESRSQTARAGPASRTPPSRPRRSRASKTRAGESTPSSRQIGVVIRAARRGVTVQVVAVEGLLEAEEPEPVEGGQPVGVGRCVGAIGVGLDAQLGKGPSHRLERGHVPARPDLELHPRDSPGRPAPPPRPRASSTERPARTPRRARPIVPPPRAARPGTDGRTGGGCRPRPSRGMRRTAVRRERPAGTRAQLRGTGRAPRARPPGPSSSGTSWCSRTARDRPTSSASKAVSARAAHSPHPSTGPPSVPPAGRSGPGGGPAPGAGRGGCPGLCARRPGRAGSTVHRSTASSTTGDPCPSPSQRSGRVRGAVGAGHGARAYGRRGARHRAGGRRCTWARRT